MSSPEILTRDVPPRAAWALEQAGLTPLLARLFAARGIRSAEELDDGLGKLLPPEGLKGIAEAARLLADCIEANERICIVADYDCDGATACAVAIRGHGAAGRHPRRLRRARPRHPWLWPDPGDRRAGPAAPADLLMTVDNGIASLAGVAHARDLGLKVQVTDHHLPALIDGIVALPAAHAIVNPSQPAAASRARTWPASAWPLYLLLALRGEFRERGRYAEDPQPRLDCLLDLVALGTVADVVRLDANNRRLVAQA